MRPKGRVGRRFGVGVSHTHTHTHRHQPPHSDSTDRRDLWRAGPGDGRWIDQSGPLSFFFYPIPQIVGLSGGSETLDRYANYSNFAALLLDSIDCRMLWRAGDASWKLLLLEASQVQYLALLESTSCRRLRRIMKHLLLPT